MSAPFGILQSADRLGAGKFSPGRAQTVAPALPDILSVRVATKADVETAKSRLEAKMQEPRSQFEAKLQAQRLSLEAKIREVKAELIKWFVGIVGFQTLVILGPKIFIK